MQVNTELERIGFKQYPSELVVCIAVELLVASEWDRQIFYTTFLIFNLCKISITDICYRKPTFISLRRKLTNKLIVLKTQSAFDFNDLLGIYVLGCCTIVLWFSLLFVRFWLSFFNYIPCRFFSREICPKWKQSRIC